MPREKPSYRDNIAAMKEFLHSKYGDERRVMSAADIAEYVGKSPRTVQRRYGVDYKGMTIETFARIMS